MTSARRLPGVRIEAAPPPVPETLPRMDVAVFAGFASTGPLHRPVAIGSVTQYAAVFGADAPLAWDSQRAERVLAHLGPSVRAFFANGGRRCWVIRVARTVQSERARAVEGAAITRAVATTNRFPVPGVLEWRGAGPVGAGGGGVAGSGAGAGSGGAAGAGTASVVAASAEARCEGSWSDGLRVATALTTQRFAINGLAPALSPAGDRYTFNTRQRLRPGDLLDFSDAPAGHIYATVESVRTIAAGGTAPLAVDVRVVAVFERVDANAAPWLIVSPAAPAATAALASADGLFSNVAVSLLPASDGRIQVAFDVPVPAQLDSGAWLRIDHAGDTLWLSIDQIARRAAAATSSASSDFAVMDADAIGPAWLQSSSFPSLTDISAASVLSLDMKVSQDDTETQRLEGVGLAPAHPASWWNYLPDATFYDLDVSGPDSRTTSSDGQRFALAALARVDRQQPVAWLPLAVEPLFGASLGAVPQPGTALERDGLADFDATLFLDPELESVRTGTLIAQADSIRFVREGTRDLFGVHAALSIASGRSFNEVSLICVPDAVHPGWRPRPAIEAEAPSPTASLRPPHWARHRGACAVEPVALPDPDFGSFLDCDTREIAAPQLLGPGAPIRPGALRLTWTPSEAHATYQLYESRLPDFSSSRRVGTVADLQIDVLVEQEGIYYYRVVAFVGTERSDDSNVITVAVRNDNWELIDDDEFGEERETELLTVHRALLRLTAASGELFAVLSMPRHFRTDEAIRYAARLREVRSGPQGFDAQAFAFDETRVLSYGALYHPWLVSGARESGARSLGEDDLASGLHIVPPDGFITGTLAARATLRGAWIAPANEILKDAVALTPLMESSNWQALQDAQVNVIRAEARGFYVLSADTLAVDTEPELRPINVRRLLTLLRRLALRRGASYVFEPNGPTLRRAVQRGFDILLTDMYRRGAFVGRTAQESFRVVTDDTLNTALDSDAGRFIVELRVAPALPLRFLSVQLAQHGERLAVTEVL